MNFQISILLISLCALIGRASADFHTIERAWNQDIIYFVITDRFHDGDPDNNRPTGSDPALYDPSQTDMDLYHGGDLRGLELAIQSGYFNDLGVTTLWITPPVRNVWHSAFDSNDAPKTGYHGYWTQDFLDIDPHLTSRQSLDASRTYADSREGRLQHYKDFVALAHAHGIKVVQDIVCNHVGPVFYYDANGNHRFDLKRKEEWIQPFKEQGFYSETRWAHRPEWSLHPTEPAKSVELLGHTVPINGSFRDFSSYGRKGFSSDSLAKSDGEEVVCDFLSLRDFWTAPGSPHFDALVDNFVEVYAFYMETIGVDGLRIDTVKHVHQEFWDAFTHRLRERLGAEHAKKLILFGEVYDGDPAVLGRYTYRADWPDETAPSIDSLLNFQFNYAVREYLRTGDQAYGTAQGISRTLEALAPTPPTEHERPYYNQSPGADGLNSSQKTINFVENHDGINRFRVRGVSERRNHLANALTLVMPGIPCLYYGTEAALQDDQATVHEDAETGRMTYLAKDEAAELQDIRSQGTFRDLAALIHLRRTLPALISGDARVLWIDSPSTETDDGIFAMVRGSGESAILIVVNAATETAATTTSDQPMRLTDAEGAPLLKPGENLEAIPLPPTGSHESSLSEVKIEWIAGQPHAAIESPPESIQFYRIVRGTSPPIKRPAEKPEGL